MKNNKGFTLVEMLVSFTLSMILVIIMFQLIISLKELYVSSGLKTELLNKQYIITNKIYSSLNEKTVVAIEDCLDPEICIQFTFNDGSTSKLEVDKTNKTLSYGGYTIKLNSDSNFKTIKVNTELYDNNRKIFYISVPIENSLYKNTNFGINIIYQYISNEVANSYTDKYLASTDAYTQVPYIKSTGTQYINLGYKAKTNTEVRLDLELIANVNTNTEQIFGTNIIGRETNTSGNAFTLNIGEAQNEPNMIYYWVDKSYSAGGEIKRGTYSLMTGRSIMTFESGYATFKGETTAVATKTEDNTDNMVLLGTYNSNTGTISALSRYDAKIYGMQIYEGTKLVKNLVPVESQETHVCGLYDTINEVFYINNGTGSFTAS